MFIEWVIKITVNISDLRTKIDIIDQEIIRLLLKRVDVVHEVGSIKNTTQSRVYVPEREALIFNKLSELSGLTPKDVQSFYTEIISFCRKFESTLNVACIKDANSLLALKKIFGEFVNPIYFSNLNKFINIDSNINYVIVEFSKTLIDALKTSKWFIINTIYIDNQQLFLLSKFPNEIKTGKDISYFFSSSSINDSSLKVDENLFLSEIEVFSTKENYKSIFEDLFNKIELTYIGSSPIIK